MLARLRERFWQWVFDEAERRWDRAHDEAHPDEGQGGAGEYRWVVEDATYSVVWSDEERSAAHAADVEAWQQNAPPFLNTRDPERTFIARPPKG